MNRVEQFPADRAFPGPDLAQVNTVAQKALGERCRRCGHTRYVHLVGDGACDFDALRELPLVELGDGDGDT